MPRAGQRKPVNFWDCVSVSDNEEACWLWTGKKTKDGHGRFYGGLAEELAHRIAYKLSVGPIPQRTLVRHKCDNPACCNPRHLVIGTHQDNVRDRVERGRSASGEKNGRAKLFAIEVQEIRNSALNDSDLSIIYGVSRRAIRKIKTGETWKSL